METLSLTKAREWLKTTGGENTLIFNKTAANGYELYTFMAMLESKEKTEDYPEEMAINFYGKSGWTLTKRELSNRAPNGTLIDKLVEEQGYHAGDMYIGGGKGIIDEYLGYARSYYAIFILGTDEDIQRELPNLKNGTYCFMFEDKNKI